MPPPSPIAIPFPIAELRNCADKQSCSAFCDDLVNCQACYDFAKSHNLLKEGERAADLPKIRPGGCSSISTCKAYCENAANRAIPKSSISGEQPGIFGLLLWPLIQVLRQ